MTTILSTLQLREIGNTFDNLLPGFILKLSDTLLSKLPMHGTWFSTSNVCHSK